MFNKKSEQKLVSFSYNKTDLDKITEEMENGWVIISLMQNGNYYVGVMEKQQNANPSDDDSDGKIFLPPIKQVRLSMTKSH